MSSSVDYLGYRVDAHGLHPLLEKVRAVRDLLGSSQLLVHYDPSLELILSCDASAYGLGKVLSHKLPNGSERPMVFASRTLSAAEKKYAQLV